MFWRKSHICTIFQSPVDFQAFVSFFSLGQPAGPLGLRPGLCSSLRSSLPPPFRPSSVPVEFQLIFCRFHFGLIQCIIAQADGTGAIRRNWVVLFSLFVLIFVTIQEFYWSKGVGNSLCIMIKQIN